MTGQVDNSILGGNNGVWLNLDGLEKGTLDGRNT